jgi:hypothetical protein
VGQHPLSYYIILYNESEHNNILAFVGKPKEKHKHCRIDKSVTEDLVAWGSVIVHLMAFVFKEDCELYKGKKSFKN